MAKWWYWWREAFGQAFSGECRARRHCEHDTSSDDIVFMLQPTMKRGMIENSIHEELEEMRANMKLQANDAVGSGRKEKERGMDRDMGNCGLEPKP